VGSPSGLPTRAALRTDRAVPIDRRLRRLRQADQFHRERIQRVRLRCARRVSFRYVM